MFLPSLRGQRLSRFWLRLLLPFALGLLLGLATPAIAEKATSRDEASTEEKIPQNDGVLALLPPDSVSEHTLSVGGRPVAYTATAGTFSLFQQNGERSAAVFYTAYVLKDAAPDRPLTFAFNGGPGAASAFLHLGLVGPRIVDFGPKGRDGAAPRLVNNAQTWLDFTDLVLIDPIGTGWSRTARPGDASDYWGVRPDAQAMAKTIALYLSHTGRAASPKYLLGESYGGFRAVKVARALRQEQGIIVSGIVMLSPLLDGNLEFGADRYPLGAALELPSLAAAELERRQAFTPEALAEADRFAMTDYLTTLAGKPPEGAAAQAFYARVAGLTGLPADVVAKSRGFIRGSFIKHLREKEIVSPYDIGFAVPDPYPESDRAYGDDPVLDGFVRAYGGTFASYARSELGFKTDMTYILLAGEISSKWDWGDDNSLSQASVSDDLRELLALDPNLRILVAHGLSDLVSPYAVSRYVLDHLPPLGEAGRVALKLYRGGHMLYLDPQARSVFTSDARIFYANSPE